MTLLPRHPVTRVVAAIWLLACFTFLLMTLVKSDLYINERSALAPLILVYFLALPSAHVAFSAVAKIKLSPYLHAGFEPSLPSEAALLWMLTVTLGYLQWFVVLPWLVRLFQRCSAALRHNDRRKYE